MQDNASGLLLVGLIGLAALTILISESATPQAAHNASKQKPLEEAALTSSASSSTATEPSTPIEPLAPIPPVSSSSIPQSIPAQPVEPGNEKNEWPVQIINSGSPNSKQIALTFDDGPHPKFTLKVLDELRERKIKATFFVLGNRVKQYPWIARQIIAEGHEIGNHTYDHRFLTAMSNELIEKEILDTQHEIMMATGYETRLFRPPYGAFRQSARQIFYNLNLAIILWSVDPKDWRYRNPEKINHFITSKTQNGSIILCHDIHASTIEALPNVLDHLQEEGFEFLTVSQLCQLPPMQISASHFDQREKEKNTLPLNLTFSGNVNTSGKEQPSMR